MTVSTPFRLTPSVYFRIAAKRTIPRVALLLAIPFVGLLIAAGVLHDMRFIFVAIMVPFIFAPMVMVHVFYSTLLHPDARRALCLQRIELAPDDFIRLSFLKEKESETDETVEPVYIESESLEIPWSHISSISLSTRCLVFHLKESRLPVALPLDALPPDLNPYEIVSF